MKKVLVVLLILAVAGGMFGQELKFAGHVRTGVMAWFGDEYSGNNEFLMLESSPGNAWRGQLNMTFTTASGFAGGFLQFRAVGESSSSTTSGVFSVPYAGIWFKPFGSDMLLIRAGKIDNTNYGTMGGIDSGGDVGSGTGVLFESAPITGLLIGFGVYPSISIAAATPLVSFNEAGYRFGVKYTMADTFAAAANFTINNKIINARFGADIIALKSAGITKLGIDAEMTDLGHFKAAGAFNLGQQVNMAFGDFGVGIRAIEYLPVRSAIPFSLKTRVYAQYVLGSITPRLEVGFGMNRELGGKYDARAWDGLGAANKDDHCLYVNPSVAFAVQGGTITLGYALEAQFGDASVLRNGIYAAFIVNF